MVDEKIEKEEFQHLTDACGHHCGARGDPDSGHTQVGHCNRPECHNVVRLV